MSDEEIFKQVSPFVYAPFIFGDYVFEFKAKNPLTGLPIGTFGTHEEAVEAVRNAFKESLE